MLSERVVPITVVNIIINLLNWLYKIFDLECNQKNCLFQQENIGIDRLHNLLGMIVRDMEFMVRFSGDYQRSIN